MRSRLVTKIVGVGVALALVGVTAADAATSRTYKGKTGQKKAISFKVKGSKITSLKFTINLTCSDGSTLTDVESGFQTIKIGKRGKINDDQVGSTDEIVMKAKKKRRKITGTLKVTDKLNSSTTCGPVTVKFSAKQKR